MRRKKGKKTRMAIAKLFALHANAIKNKKICFKMCKIILNVKFECCQFPSNYNSVTIKCFLGAAAPSICHFFRLSIRHTSCLRNCASSDHNFRNTCKMMIQSNLFKRPPLLCKTTSFLRQPMLSPLKKIPIQSLLQKTTTCLTRPATTFVSHMKKNLSKINNHYKTLPILAKNSHLKDISPVM